MEHPAVLSAEQLGEQHHALLGEGAAAALPLDRFPAQVAAQNLLVCVRVDQADVAAVEGAEGVALGVDVGLKREAVVVDGGVLEVHVKTLQVLQRPPAVLPGQDVPGVLGPAVALVHARVEVAVPHGVLLAAHALLEGSAAAVHVDALLRAPAHAEEHALERRFPGGGHHNGLVGLEHGGRHRFPPRYGLGRRVLLRQRLDV